MKPAEGLSSREWLQERDAGSLDSVTDIAQGLSVSGQLLLNIETVQDILGIATSIRRCSRAWRGAEDRVRNACGEAQWTEPSLDEQEGIIPPGCYPVGNQRNEENLSLSPIQLLVLVCCTFHSFVITSVSQSGIVFCLSWERSLKLFWVHNTLVFFPRPILDWILADYTSAECLLSCLTSSFSCIIYFSFDRFLTLSV